MVSRKQQAVDEAWIYRARELAGQVPPAAEILTFFAALAEFQNALTPRAVSFEELPDLTSDVMSFADQHGTDLLRASSQSLTPEVLAAAIDDYWYKRDTVSPISFFARVVMQPWAACGDVKPVDQAENLCPRCGHVPQVARLQPQGQGSALSLVCSLCFHEWDFQRLRCASCLDQNSRNQEFYVAESFEAVHVNVCRSCGLYVLCVDTSKDPACIPYVDELAAIPLDIWAQENGYQKLQPNVAGM